MKILKNKFSILMIFWCVLIILPNVYAKTSIEIKPNASTVYTNKTISEFFDASLEMKDVGEGLEGSNVDVHMAKNIEWAIASYFSNSSYGTGGEGKNTGVNVTIGGKSYLSTNGNITGIMDLGKTDTYTAGVVSGYEGISDTSTVYANGKSIIENAINNSKHVDILKNNDQFKKASAFRNWYGIIGWPGELLEYPYSVRSGLFGGAYGAVLKHLAEGAAKSDITFRPVICNTI